MSEENKEFKVEDENMSMEEALTTFGDTKIKPEDNDKIIKAKVLAVNQEEVTVDIGLKSEAFIPIIEFDEEGSINVKVGDEIDVFLFSREGSEGLPHVSYQKAKNLIVLKDLQIHYQSGTPMEVLVKSSIKGGYRVDIGLDAFMPRSLAPSEVRYVKDISGKKYYVIITEFDLKRQNIVVSAKAFEDIEREKHKKVLLETIYPGSKLKGSVKSITNYGAFIDLGGMDGLLHISDMSWSRVDRVENILKVGQEAEVIVLFFDKENEKISLGLKQLSADPWDTIEYKVKIGSILNGKVLNLVKSGAFIELIPGVEGFVHLNDLSWTKKVYKISDILKKNDEVNVKVLGYDKEKRQVTLGLKQVESSPWEKVNSRYNVNDIITGTVTSLTNFGAFVRLEEGIEGMVHVDNMSWTKSKKQPKDVLKRGDVVDVVILDINVEGQRISLGLKQKENDPFKKYKVGQNHKGIVVYIGDKHLAIRFEDDFEGIIPFHYTGARREEILKDRFKKSDSIIAKLIKIEEDRRQLVFSIKDYNKEKQKEEIKAYLGANDFTPTFGDLLKRKFKKTRDQRLETGEEKSQKEIEEKSSESVDSGQESGAESQESSHPEHSEGSQPIESSNNERDSSTSAQNDTKENQDSEPVSFTPQPSTKFILGAVFDLDGVIVDTVPIHFKAWKKMFEEYGKTFTFEDYQAKVDGIPRVDGTKSILTDLSDEQIEEASNKKQKYFLEFLEEEPIPIFDSTVLLVKELRSKGIRTAVVSSSKNCPYILEKTNLSNLFHTVVTASDVSKGKPEPDMFLFAASKINVTPELCVGFEDAVLGVEALKRAGMICIGVDRHNEPERLKRADIVVKDLEEIDYAKIEEIANNGK